MLTTTPVIPTGWPPTKVGTGPALDRLEVALRLGYAKVGPVDALIRRTRRGKPPVPFPAPSGHGIRPERRRTPLWDYRPAGVHVVPYWFERDVVHYGKLVGLLDADGKPVGIRPRNQRPSTRTLTPPADAN